MDGLIWKDVDRVCAVAEASKTLSGLRDSAMINLMSDCLLRIAEVVAVNVGDVKGSVLHVQSSKTDQEASGEALYICESTRRVLRVGSAVSFARAGATVVDIQMGGRWGSPSMPAHYAKAELAERGAIARFKDGK